MFSVICLKLFVEKNIMQIYHNALRKSLSYVFKVLIFTCLPTIQITV